MRVTPPAFPTAHTKGDAVENPVAHYWRLRLEACRKALEANGFEVHVAASAIEAGDIILRDIFPRTGAKVIGYADSMTLHATRALDRLRSLPALSFIETFDETASRETIIDRRRKALLSDLFLTGTNAVTETGLLVNLDMVGNRTAAIAFGPKHVVLAIGRNKICPDLGEAMARVKEFAAPVNAIRHPGFRTPCMKTSFCMDCKSPDRICNVWAITEKSFPEGRIKIVLIDEALGL